VRSLPFVALGAVQRVRNTTHAHAPIAVAGSRELVPLLAKELRAGGDAGAVTEGPPPGHAAALVWIGPPDETVLRSASRRRTPIVALTEGESVPYVLDTHLVRVAPGRPLPVDETAAALARVLGAAGPGLAGRLPVLRPHVVQGLIRRTALRNTLIGAAAFLPGPDHSPMTINQAVLVLRMAVAEGKRADVAGLWPELAGVLGASFVLRQAARRLELLPLPRFAVRGGVALAGTWAIGAALRLRLK
jgi:hypothetical protein